MRSCSSAVRDVSDDDMRTLAALSRLNYLSLHDTNVSDAGLAALGRCRSLEYVEVRGTHVTQKGVDAICAMLPRLKVDWSTVCSEAVRRAAVELAVGGRCFARNQSARWFYLINFQDGWDGDRKRANELLKTITAGERVTIGAGGAKGRVLDLFLNLPDVGCLFLSDHAVTNDDDLSVLPTIGRLTELVDRRQGDHRQGSGLRRAGADSGDPLHWPVSIYRQRHRPVGKTSPIDKSGAFW